MINIASGNNKYDRIRTISAVTSGSNRGGTSRTQGTRLTKPAKKGEPD